MMRYFFTFHQSIMLKEKYIYFKLESLHNVQFHYKILKTQIKETPRLTNEPARFEFGLICYWKNIQCSVLILSIKKCKS